jgi:hypothetical protein
MMRLKKNVYLFSLEQTKIKGYNGVYRNSKKISNLKLFDQV